MATVRPPAVAGRFYPADPARLVEAVRAHLDQAKSASDARPKALIVPHAGYVYSGPIAGSAYATLRARRAEIERVVLLGPAHRVWLRGLATPSVDCFETPLGAVTLDHDATRPLLETGEVQVSDEAHAFEHSLEVQLPFLQELLDDFSLVPLVVGEATGAQVAKVIEHLWGGPETLIVVSSDLSHYLDYATARRIDAETSRAIEALRPEALRASQACGRIPVQGLLLAARAHGLGVEVLDVRSTGDTAGDRDRVVGYGAYVFA